MAMSKKHQTVGQRYQIGDRVYRKSVTLGSGNGQKYRTRYGTITTCNKTWLTHCINWANTPWKNYSI